MFKPRFFYDDNAEGGNGGGAAADVVPQPLLTADQLKDYGIESPEQLQTLLQQHKESKVSVEEKQRQADEREADLIKFSVDQKLMTVEEYQQSKTLKGKADRDLVFERYEKEWREDHPEITDEEEISSNVRRDFDDEYRVNSENEKSKGRGAARLAKEAAEIRNPFLNKLTAAEQQYTERKAIAGKVPEFNKFVDNLIEKLTPEKLTVSKVKEGEQEIPIEVELSKEERKELAKAFRTPKAFAAFSSAQDPTKEFEASMTKKITGFLKEKYFDAAINTTYEKGKGVGLAKGSTVGAGQPFAVVRGGHQDNTGKQNISVAQEVRDSHNKIREKYN